MVLRKTCWDKKRKKPSEEPDSKMKAMLFFVTPDSVLIKVSSYITMYYRVKKVLNASTSSWLWASLRLLYQTEIIHCSVMLTWV